MKRIIVGGKIVPWLHPRWRRALYQLGVTGYHHWLGDWRRHVAAEAAAEKSVG